VHERNDDGYRLRGVAYTNGGVLDRRLSVVRMNYVENEETSAQRAESFNAFALVPLWDARGSADMGSAEDGGAKHCECSFTLGKQICVDGHQWPAGWSPRVREHYVRFSCQGSLLEDKQDGSGMLSRRNRYVDPSIGRFTQEDPIGIAGGVNVYAFAVGDPVSYSDPFGLCPTADGTDDGKTCTITVPAWDGIGVNPSGHVSASVNGMTFSFGPVSAREMVGGAGTTVSGKTDAEFANQNEPGRGHKTFKLQLTQAQATVVATTLTDWNSSFYGVIDLHCTDPLQDALRASGGTLPRSQTPGALISNLKNKGLIRTGAK
jgi:RHS repeat-associated protein